MTNEVKNVPELRFPNFSEEWKKFVFKDQIISIEKGTDLLGTEDNMGIPLIKMGNIKRGYFSFNKLEKLRESETIQEKYYIKKGDFLFNTRNTMELVGKSATWTNKSGEFAFNSNIARLVLKDIDTYFFNYLYNTSKMINKVKSLAVGTTSVAAIYPRDLNHLNYFLPLIAEQEKIGEFFSKLDRQIELEEQKLAKLEEQKKGYMQQIFSQELRFKDEDGNIYPDWKEYVLGETGNTYSGLSSKTKEDFGYGDSYFITYMNVFKNTIAKVNMIEKVNIQENEKQNKVNYKDILFTTSSEVPEETGMSSIWLYKESNVYLNSFCFGFRVTCDDIEPIYLTRFLRSEKMRKQITILSQGSTRFNISKKEVMKLKIDVPNLEEQTKIVNFLSKYDSLIESQSSKIDLLKERKKGFLQKMFV